MPELLENTEDLLDQPPFYQPEDEPIEAQAPPVIKRGRGRPRKHPRPEDIVAAVGADPLEIKIVGNEKPSKAFEEIREKEDFELAEYLNSLTGSYGSVRIRITRLYPKAWKGHQIEGSLDTFDEPISEEQIKELYGGGHYDIMILRPNPKVKEGWIYATRRKIKISGDPILRDTADERPIVNESFAERTAVETLSKLVIGGHNQPRGSDPALQSLIGGLQSQLEVLQKSLAAKDDRLLEIVNKKPETSTSDKLLEKMMDGESIRMQTLREQHRSEINAVRERLQADVERIHASYKDQVNMMSRAHEREIDSINRSNDGRIEALKLAHDSVTSGFKRELAHLDRELGTARAELAALKSEKQKSPVESATELLKLKDALGDAFGGGGDGEAPSTVERILGTLAPIAQGIGQRFADGQAGPGPQAGQPGRPQQPTQADIEREFPINQPKQMADGRWFVRKASGEIVPVRPKKKPKVEIKGGEEIQIDPGELKQVVKFMEGSVGTEPQIFAQSIRSMIPISLQKVIGANSQGVDHFLDEVANLEPGSPLSYQAGREWVREVAKYIYRP